MVTAVEPFSFAIAELSDIFISKFPQSDIIPKCMEKVSVQTGVQVVKGGKGFGIKGSWVSLSMAHALLVEFLATYETAELTDCVATRLSNLNSRPTLRASKYGSTTTSAESRSLRTRKNKKKPSDDNTCNAKTKEKRTAHIIKDQQHIAVAGILDFERPYKGESDPNPDIERIQNDQDDDQQSSPGLEESDSLISDINKADTGIHTPQDVRTQSVDVSQDVFQKSSQTQPNQVPTIKAKKGQSKKYKQESFLKKYKRNRCHNIGGTVFDDEIVKFPEKPVSRTANVKCSTPSKKAHGQENGFACSECDYTTTSKTKISDHIQHTHKGSAVRCDLCGKVFPNQSYMHRHRLSHVAPQHCCDVCGKMFKIEKAMVKHRRTHEAGYTRPVYHCKMCPKTFCSQYIVDCHVRSAHMGLKKSYLCSYCGKKFTTKHALQEHSNAHSGIRPHICEICGKGFSYESALRDHKFTHEQQKQFQCSLCSKSFCQRSGLKMHMRIHKDTRQFRCEECGREFTQKQALQRHERVHKGVKPFVCKLCSRSFTDASIIRRHLILVHKIHKDAKTWREDIICTVKPDLEYHVGLVGEQVTSSREQNVVQIKNSIHSQHNRRKPLPSERVISILSTALKPSASAVASAMIATNGAADRAVQQMTTECENMQLHDRPNVPEHCSEFQSIELPQTHMPEAEPLKSPLFTSTCTSQSFSFLHSVLSSTPKSLSLSIKGQHKRSATDSCGSSQEAAETHPDVACYSTSSLQDTSSHPGFPTGLFAQQNNFPLDCHHSPTPHNPPSADGSSQNRNEQEDVTAAESVPSSVSTTVSSPGITPQAPHPWSSFYYYSQLASKFGMNFADYPYLSNGSLSGSGLETGSRPSSLRVEHPSPVHLLGSAI